MGKKERKKAKGKNSQNDSVAPYLAIGQKTEATRASRFLMRNYSKKNTMTHLIIMPFLPKVHITNSHIPGTWAFGAELLQHGVPPCTNAPQWMAG